MIKRILIYGFSLALISYLGYQVYSLQGERMELEEEYTQIEGEFNKLNEDNAKLKGELEYLAEPYNLEKELRSRFNYKLPNENLIIVVPEEDDATSTSE